MPFCLYCTIRQLTLIIIKRKRITPFCDSRLKKLEQINYWLESIFCCKSAVCYDFCAATMCSIVRGSCYAAIFHFLTKEPLKLYRVFMCCHCKQNIMYFTAFMKRLHSATSTKHSASKWLLVENASNNANAFSEISSSPRSRHRFSQTPIYYNNCFPI